MIKHKGDKTIPPPVQTLEQEVTQWQIFDYFMIAFEKSQKESEGEKKMEHEVEAVKKEEEDPTYSEAMRHSLKLIERIVLQNANEDIFDDYKYYEDLSDEPDSKHGTALPLWRYISDRTKQKQVTSICWNPKYRDLFVVGYGTYKFVKTSSTGAISCFTIKNPIFPEYSFQTESEVMCLHFHPQRPALLAVGLYDGSVLVYDIRIKNPKANPIYRSTVHTKKHMDHVWQVCWQNDESGKQPCFYSISSDGRVTSWTLMKHKLEPEDIIKLKIVPKAKEDGIATQEKEDESSLINYAGGMCFDFNKFNDSLYLVGTEEGSIHLCSKAYSGQYLETYEGHLLAVY